MSKRSPLEPEFRYAEKTPALTEFESTAEEGDLVPVAERNRRRRIFILFAVGMGVGTVVAIGAALAVLCVVGKCADGLGLG